MTSHRARKSWNFYNMTGPRPAVTAPRWSLQELAAEFGIQPRVLSHFLKEPGAPQGTQMRLPTPRERQDGSLANRRYDPREVRAWWATRHTKPQQPETQE
jgi:hypothetical protein